MKLGKQFRHHFIGNLFCCALVTVQNANLAFKTPHNDVCSICKMGHMIKVFGEEERTDD